VDPLAAVIHDLRQPLDALLILSARLAGLNRDPALVDLARHNLRAAQALEAGFTAWLEQARLDGGQWPVQCRPVALAEQAAWLALGPAVLAQEAGLAWRCRLPAGAAVSADPDRLQRVLFNLLGNALRHARSTVLWGARRRGAVWRVQVWDDGPGLPSDQLMLDQRAPTDAPTPGPSARAPRRPGDPPGRGLGLGLAQSRRLLADMGAVLHLRSWPGQGSCCEFELPAAAALGPDQADPPDPAGAELESGPLDTTISKGVRHDGHA
jgi:signal transduction histidine kinase